MHSVLVRFRVLHIIIIALIFISVAQIRVNNIMYLFVVNSIIKIKGNLYYTFRIILLLFKYL
jgi:hypothetical protein